VNRAQILACSLLVASCGGSSAGDPPPVDATAPDGPEPGRDAAVEPPNDADARDAIADAIADVDAGDVAEPSCFEPAGRATTSTNRYVDGADEARVTIEPGEGACTRRYSLSSTAPRRDALPTSPRVLAEVAGAPRLRSRNDLLDAIYAQALEEVRENSVAAIRDGAFENGAPVECPRGGCFETGRKWNYVWTRDTAYAVDLGLARLDPSRARASLEFKLSERRGGSGLEIVQDTGTGGSWPISTDRVVWALGARAVFDALGDSEEGRAFRGKTKIALRNTVERDRVVAFDPRDGLYRGETSFLDWREQTYHAETAVDPVLVGTSKSLSTNVGHLVAIETAAALETDAAVATRLRGWADALRTALRERFWLPDDEGFSSFVPGDFDPAPVRRYDALATALAILHDVATPAQAKAALSKYPHFVRGVPVIWPQQKDVPIYHNRGIWPFVTGYVARAARKAGHDAVFDHAIESLLRASALNLSNVENLEAVTGRAFVEDGPASGPVVNSQRQLWSVAAIFAAVDGGLFGLDARDDGLAIAPFVTRKLRNGLLAAADELALIDHPWRGRKLSVVVKLPPRGPSAEGGVYAIGAITIDGRAHTGIVRESDLKASSRIEVTLVDDGSRGLPMTVVRATSDYRNLFGPRPPSITALETTPSGLRLSWDRAGEIAAEVTFDVYRDGVRVASALGGGTTSWTDRDRSAASPSVCYVVEAAFASGTRSQHSLPRCFWAGGSRIRTWPASALVAIGGSRSNDHGREHLAGWGDPGHSIAVRGFVPAASGDHLIQLVAGNGAGPINTGIACATELVEVREGGDDGPIVARGTLSVPHLGTWSVFRESSTVRAALVAGRSYTIVVRPDETTANMTFFEHFARYTGGTGGTGGPFAKINVAEVKVLRMSP
jgi:hypothetical protein